MELSKTYDAKQTESKWYKFWEENKFFHAKAEGDSQPFTIVIPPPNVTGILHMGHALNNSIQDIMIRWKRMQGVPTLWVPGTDHAGIATQNVVEKKLHKEDKTRHDLGKDAFIDEVWKWKEEHGSTIIRQLKKLGSSCDWDRERFTMDEGLSKAVREVFVSLYEKGLIYRGNYIVNWCPRCHTALSDEEAAHQDSAGKFYYIKYPIGDKCPDVLPEDAVEGKDYVVIATTRPETMLGDTAVAVNPDDERYDYLKGQTIALPLVNRVIPVIEDSYVDKEFGSGVVKITPAHDPNDFDMGKRHNLEEINVMDIDATINENGGPYKGLDRFEARKKIIEDLDKMGLFIKADDHAHSVGHCYRCDTVVEPYLSKQWFVKMKPLAEPALKAAREGDVKFVPERWTKIYFNWLENIRDWCISRQIWWGHRIPVWYCDDCDELTVSREDVTECGKCGSKNIKQDPDVLDTWFSSWLWPFSTLGWPEKTDDLDVFYPNSMLVTAPDILFFWVARMIMAGIEFMGEVPFHTVYLHGVVRDETGRKMSKSLGNSIDPLSVVDQVGADALRFVIISLTSQGQDVNLSEQKFMVGRNFTNKIWNAARFAFMNLDGFTEGNRQFNVEGESLSTADKWILTKLNKLIDTLDDNLNNCRFNDASTNLYSFIWNDFCDWYLELSKPVFYDKRTPEEKKSTQKVLFYVMCVMLRLLHPFMPHITEELWQGLKSFCDEGMLEESIMIAEWPKSDKSLLFESSLDEVEFMKDVIVGVREKRAQHQISPNSELKVTLVPEADGSADLIAKVSDDIETIAKTEGLIVDADFEKGEGWMPLKLTSALKYIKGFVFLGDIVDFEKERARLEKEKQRLTGFITGIEKKLGNENFVKRAPADVVEKEKKKLEDNKLALKKIEEQIAEL